MKKNTLIFRIMLLTLAALLLLPLAACGGNGGDAGESETTAPETEAPDTERTFVTFEEILTYEIVRPDQGHELVKTAMVQLYNEMSRKFGDKIRPKTDFYREGIPALTIGDYEVLVGPTNRPESAQFISRLRLNDFGYTLTGKKIVIAGGCDEATVSAVNAFIHDFVDAEKSGDYFMTSRQELIMRASYDINVLTVGEQPIETFRIVYPDGSGVDANTAQFVADAVSAASGWVLTVTSDKTPAEEGQAEILIGQTNRGTAASGTLANGEAYVGSDGKNFLIWGNDVSATLAGARDFIAAFASVKQNTFSVPTEARKVTFDNTHLTAMSFNVLVSNRTDERIKRVTTMVQNYLPDTVGFQEASPEWMSSLTKALGSTYAHVGEGRDGGSNGEYNPIFYNKSKFNLLDSGTRWLSDTPEKVSKYEQSSLNRIWTYALLQRKSDGAVVMVVNTHFDHVSEEARDLQAIALGKFLAKCFERNYPIILTGDFNTTSDKPCYSSVLASGVKNAFSVRLSGASAATFTNYGNANRIIDFIFVSPAEFIVHSYKVCNEKINGDFPSDHHPVLIEYSLVK